jgi:hypothetical protein
VVCTKANHGPFFSRKRAAHKAAFFYFWGGICYSRRILNPKFLQDGSMKLTLRCTILFFLHLTFALPAFSQDEAAESESSGKASSSTESRFGKRDDWYIGFGIYPVGKMTFNGESPKPDSKSGFNFGAGATYSKNVLIGGEISSFSQTYGDEDASATVSTTGIGPTITYFPQETGFFVKGGLYSTKITLDFEVFGLELSTSASGYGAGIGSGYAWWLGETFNLVASLEYQTHKYKGDLADKANFWMGGLGFQWY